MKRREGGHEEPGCAPLLQELSGLWKVCCTEHHLQPNKLDPAP